MQQEISALLPPTVKSKVLSIPERELSVWIGGSILASLTAYRQQAVSKADYDETGPSVIHTKSVNCSYWNKVICEKMTDLTSNKQLFLYLRCFNCKLSWFAIKRNGANYLKLSQRYSQGFARVCCIIILFFCFQSWFLCLSVL